MGVSSGRAVLFANGLVGDGGGAGFDQFRGEPPAAAPVQVVKRNQPGRRYHTRQVRSLTLITSRPDSKPFGGGTDFSAGAYVDMVRDGTAEAALASDEDAMPGFDERGDNRWHQTDAGFRGLSLPWEHR